MMQKNVCSVKTDRAELRVAVVIAAYNAVDTIERAVRSALVQPEAAEVVVVDDQSSDGTYDAARASDDGSGRLKVIRAAKNAGPSAARNRAITETVAPIIGLLDADDFYFSGRLGALLGHTGWDMIADNIVFMAAGEATENPDIWNAPRFAPVPVALSDFVTRNLSASGKARTEYGFLKPLIRRDFLEAAGLSYREDLRFGEDYDLYLRALAAGARLLLIDNVGYGAVLLETSLSHRHATADLARLAGIDRQILDSHSLDAPTREALARHERHVQHKFWLRDSLDVRRSHGRLAALWHLFRRPARLLPVARGVLADKTAPAGHRVSARFLLP